MNFTTFEFREKPMQKHGLTVSMVKKKQLRKEFSNFLKKLSIPHEEDYTDLLIEASSHESYIETLSNKADSLNYHLKKGYLEIFDKEFSRFAGKFVQKQRLGLVDIVVDVTEENFYGKSTGLFIHPWTKEKGIMGKFRYLVAGIVWRNKIFPFYAAILPRGVFKAELLGNIADLCNKMRLHVRVMKLDRGFYSGSIIKELELKGMQYLIFVPKKQLFKHMLEATRKSIVVKHEIKYCEDKSSHIAETNIALVKNVNEYDWCFATNLFLQDARKYVPLYRGRWNIETMFRVHDEARIKSKSIKPIVRAFYFMISMLLVLLWNLYAKQDYTFKGFIIMLEEISEQVHICKICRAY